MNIREGTPDDAAAMQAIYAHYVRHSPVTFEEEVPAVEDMRRRIETVLERHAFFVAEDGAGPDGGVFGYAYAAPYRARPAYRYTAEVSVYIHHARHAEGTGRALYARLMAWLAQHGFRAAVAALTLPNEASVRLHEGAGFEKVGHFRDVGRKFDRWHDVGWWEKVLEGRRAGEPMRGGADVPGSNAPAS